MMPTIGCWQSSQGLSIAFDGLAIVNFHPRCYQASPSLECFADLRGFMMLACAAGAAILPGVSLFGLADFCSVGSDDTCMLTFAVGGALGIDFFTLNAPMISAFGAFGIFFMSISCVVQIELSH